MFLQNEVFGCMTGILKLFDYQEMLTTGRITGHSSKRNPIGGSHFNKDASEMESKPMEKHFNKHVQDKRTIYAEYSGFPSSSPPQQDILLFDPLIMPENCSTGPRTRQVSTTSAESYRQSYYLQEVVKDSMYQEARKQPSKTNVRNSQKTLNQTDATYGMALYGRNEPNELSRPSSYQSKEVSFFSITKEAPRFSYDEKESSFKPRDVSKYQDMARLSRDGRESSTRSLKSETQPNLFTNPSRNSSVTPNCPRNSHQQNSGTQIRSPSVVAKLMGLDALPNIVEPCRPVQASVQSKSLSKESNSPRWKNPGSTIKPISRLPMEPAPWKQVDRSMKDSSVKTRNSFPSVYSEIEKRLKDLEFSQSGKDLRALKQILEAMQEKEEEEENGKNPRFVADQKDHVRKCTSSKSKNELIYSFTKQGGSLSRNYESPIVIMKPAKHTAKSDYPIDELSGDTKSNSRVLKTTQTTSTRSLQSAKNRSTDSLKSNGSIGSRVLHKKQPESEKRPGPRVPLTNSGRSRTRSNKQENGSSSSSTSRRHRSNYSVRNDEEMSEFSNESTNNSAQSDGSILSESKMDMEATSSERNLDMTNFRNPFTKTFKNSVSCLIEKESILVMEHPEIAPEYPSPVSVLDSILDIDDSPSPIIHESKTSRGYETRDSDAMGSGNPFEFNRRKLKNIENLVQKLQSVNSSHDEARTDYIASLCENTNPDHRYISEILLASGILLSDIGSSSTNFQFHPSGHPINPGLFLVLEQTKASSFLEYRSEKTTIHLKSKQKIHRKIIFDTVNEVLGRKFISLQQPFSLRSRKLARTTLNAQKLLRELCLEIDELQSKKTKHKLENDDDGLKDVLHEDVMNPLDGWLDNTSKVSSIVLNIERLVFKDLVDEVLLGETPCLRNNSSRRRQLFPK